jgi:hypothetical protein
MPVFDLLPHELTLRLVDALGGRVLAAELLRMERENLVTELVVNAAAGPVRLACRLADALLLALRSGAMIRMSRRLLVHAEGVDGVMRALPEQARLFVAGRVEDIERTARERSPLVAARRERAPQGSASDARREIISAAQRILEQRGPSGDARDMDDRARSVSPARVRFSSGPQLEIKILSVSRDEGAGEERNGELGHPRAGGGRAPERRPDAVGGEVSRAGGSPVRIRLDPPPSGAAPCAPGMGLPGNVLAGLGLSRSEKEAIGRETSEEARWAMLLRLLPPATKVPM